MHGTAKHDRLPAWVTFPLALGLAGGLVWCESRRPLRRSKASKPLRFARNLGIAGITAGVLKFAEEPVIRRVLRLMENRKWGLLNAAPLPSWAKLSLGVILLDYTLYFWHRLTHRVPRLWRFHLVHHMDLDLDVSTAFRFHFGEMLISVVWRAGQVAILGTPPGALALWRLLLPLSVMFHHSNIALPIRVEREINKVIVTPRMHGIHHSAVREETNSNWSSGLTLWDRLHGTLRLNVPQEAITIGIPAFLDDGDQKLPRLLALPFLRRPMWGKDLRGPASGTDRLCLLP